jgi:hypothetical protein
VLLPDNPHMLHALLVCCSTPASSQRRSLAAVRRSGGSGGGAAESVAQMDWLGYSLLVQEGVNLEYDLSLQ